MTAIPNNPQKQHDEGHGTVRNLKLKGCVGGKKLVFFGVMILYLRVTCAVTIPHSTLRHGELSF